MLLFPLPGLSICYRFSSFFYTSLSDWVLCFKRMVIPREAIIPLGSTNGVRSLASTRVLLGMQQAKIHWSSCVTQFFHACAIGQHRNASTCFHASLFAGIPGSDYINANYIDGYRKQNAYIATQGALPETFGDFWRMMWEQRGATVVMMTKLEERSRVRTTYTMLIVSYLSNHLHKVFASVLYVCLLYMHKNWFFF